jgi:hypothetical protein
VASVNEADCVDGPVFKIANLITVEVSRNIQFVLAFEAGLSAKPGRKPKTFANRPHTKTRPEHYHFLMTRMPTGVYSPNAEDVDLGVEYFLTNNSFEGEDR